MSFDRLAKHYRWMEFILAGRVLQRARTAFLHETTEIKSALFLGEGNGRFLVPFLQHNLVANVLCVEESAAMIRAAKNTLKRNGLDPVRVIFLQRDALTWNPPPETFDLIVSHFFLDCFTEEQLRDLIPRIAMSARPRASWLFADFQLPPGRFARLRATLIHRLMYAFFRIATHLPARSLTPPDPFLQSAGFRQSSQITLQCGLIRSDFWSR